MPASAFPGTFRYLLVSAFVLILLAAAADPAYPFRQASRQVTENEPEYRQQRMEMIRQQIEARGIDDPKILAAFEKVKRHLFVPGHLKKFAYEDRPLPIGEGQTISQPYIVALMTRAIDPEKNKKILEIGTGSGYQAAILAELCGRVYTIEIIEFLAIQARQRLSELGYDNVHVRIGDGYKGWPERAPFDGIIVTCAPAEIPGPLKEQLAEGGRMVIPVGRGYDQELLVVEKSEGRLVKKHIIPVLFVPMVDQQGRLY